MKKIILLSGRDRLPKGVMDFASDLNSMNPILLSGLFLPQPVYLDTLLYYSAGAAAPILYNAPLDEEILVEEKAMLQFEHCCEKNGIEYRVHEEPGTELVAALRKETRFADVLLLSNEVFLGDADVEAFKDYTDDLLHHAECPILIVPENFRKPKSLLLAYDGSPDSVFAIRQFAMLFPELTDLPALLFYMHPDTKKDVPDRDYIVELATRHFSDLTLFKIPFSPEKCMPPWLEGQSDTMLITGAMNRSALSRMVRKSFIKEIVKAHELPVFIAHK